MSFVSSVSRVLPDELGCTAVCLVLCAVVACFQSRWSLLASDARTKSALARADGRYLPLDRAPPYRQLVVEKFSK